MSYFQERLQLLGITEEDNQIKLLQYDSEAAANVLKPVPIFREHKKGIEIIVYTIHRELIRIEKDGAGRKDGTKMKDHWSIVRLETPAIKPNGDTMKYQMPKGHGSYPFFPPALLDKFDAATQIKTLYITEGFFKAFKGAMHGLDIVGVASITHLKNKETGGLHADILELVKQCKVERVVWLTDGDVFDLSSKANDPKEQVDLYKRPYSFYSSIATFKTLLDDYDVEKWFMHINTDQIHQEHPDQPRGQYKGLDDVLIAFPNDTADIVADLQQVSKRGRWIKKYNITTSTNPVYNEFRFRDVTEFFLWHVDRKEISQDKEFIFHGSRYRYDDEKGSCKLLVPGAASDYCRVGTQYYKFVKVPNKYGQMERQLLGWDKTTIIDDHGKDFLKHVSKYQAFCNVPDHINYQLVIHNCLNVYNPLDFQPQEENATIDDFPNIYGFMVHIFGHNKVHFKDPGSGDKKEYSMLELGMDYVQLIYQRPWQKLPILCLVSKENNTGKSTFGKLLKQILGGNCAVVGNQDLAGDFNKHWATKALVICDETKIDKQAVIEKVKSLSTAEKIMMNSKGKDHVEIDCFIKFMFITNNEENFIYASEDDIRYWIIKVPTITKENPGLMDNMIEEIPAFLNFLSRRKMVTDNLNRMWFHPSLLKTEALRRVIEYSKPTVEKEIIEYMRDAFMDFGCDEIYMSGEDVRKEILNNRYERNYVAKVLKDSLKLDMFHVWDFEGKEYPHDGDALKAAMQKYEVEELQALSLIKKVYKTKRYSYPKMAEDPAKKERNRSEVSCLGRPYIFKKERFLTAEQLAHFKPDPEQKHISEMTSNSGIPDSGFVPKEGSLFD